MISLGFSCWQVSNRWQKQVCDALKPLELTHVQYLLLKGIAELNQAKQAASQAKVAAYVGTDIMMTSKVCRTLAQKKLIIRANNRQDTRAKSLIMTHKGAELLQAAHPLISQANLSFFKGLSELERNQLQALCNAVLASAEVEAVLASKKSEQITT